MRKIRLALETALTRLVLAVVPACPRPLIRAAAACAGGLAWLACRKLRRVAMANLDLAFGETMTRAEKRHVALQSFRNVALVLLDTAWFSRDTAKRAAAHVRIEPALNEALARSPVAGVTGHFGNWELLSRALAAAGFSHVAVAATVKNPAVDAAFNRIREIPGVKILPRSGAVRGALRALRSGRHAAFLLDQNVKPEQGGVFVEFFGTPALMSTVAAVLSARAGAPIQPLFCEIEAGGKYRIYGTAAIIPGRDADAVETTQRVAQALEQEIRRAPGQWLWMYKRWKYVDLARPGANYPFYRKQTKGGAPTPA